MIYSARSVYPPCIPPSSRGNASYRLFHILFYGLVQEKGRMKKGAFDTTFLLDEVLPYGPIIEIIKRIESNVILSVFTCLVGCYNTSNMIYLCPNP